MTFRHLPTFLAGLLVSAVLATPGAAAALDRAAVVAGLCGNAGQMFEAAAALTATAATGSDEDRAWALALPRALIEKTLACDAAGAVLGNGRLDAVSRVVREPAPDARAPVLSLKNRAVFEQADAALALRSTPDAGARAAALRMLERRPATIPEGLLDAAAARESDPALKAQIEGLAQTAALNASDPTARLRAIGRIAENPSRRALAQMAELTRDPAYATNADFRAAIDAATRRIERGIAIGDVLAALYNGLSFASILFMAAIGLAIIFGLMGVINLAQGELIMIGAYVTWMVQQGLRAVAPALLDWYLILAIPVAFVVTAAIGIALEALLLRHLYKRPLMSLLATWAVSLFLVNLVRVVFGTQNMQFETPFYVSGGVPVIGDFIFTWNRMFAIAFAVVTLALTWAIVRKTPLGLNIRAVTQNRDMAACIGIPTRSVDRMAFGLGSGLAGLAGLALSPIYSVNPQMGQNFIIDSFMVVVLGGVGTIAGTVVAALGIGQINVLIEPLWGAVAAKVIVLLMIIAFLQWRPEGLFAVKGRRK
ncbi:urea transport system permease protein [Angulomicrobium tetraedrale]|uniref:Urea transport system permease protein n=1 Tax=Ancylobacter tetraedralis TaxID=217068 RepID=A0A839Z697_9HYPH|nr:urea ABC transporter permease subunit UrtB [Ancylobacter tetraedralis]MBB3771202.1 urea transport system permease protein [Ancylobacter tetraedralis]